MITPTNITQQLKTYLPIFTDRFTDLMTVISASVDAAGVMTVASLAHGKTAGQSVVMTGGDIRNPLSAAALDGDSVVFTTKYDHDLIAPSQPLDDTTIELRGFGSVWDGVHAIIDVPDRNSFKVRPPSGETTAPVVDESQYLVERCARGVQVVTSTPDVLRFTVALDPGYPSPVDNLKIVAGFRISAAADFTRAKAVYTQQASGDAYLFVIMTDGDISKDRHTHNDGVAGITAGDMQLLRVLRNFSTVAFFPTTNDLSGADAQDLAYDSVYSSLISTLYGFKGGGEVIQYGAVPSGDGPAEYNTAYYAHTYDWQLPGTITYQDGFAGDPDVAFRDIADAFRVFNDSEAEMTVNINLDRDAGVIPDGYARITDSAGEYITDSSGEYIIAGSESVIPDGYTRITDSVGGYITDSNGDYILVGIGSSVPAGYVRVADSSGEYITDSTGAYILVPE